MSHHPLYLGVDVGTSSARAGVFSECGQLQGMASEQIQIFRPREDHAEQSSEDIWRACGDAVRGALKAANATPESVKGIGFDATCSLVVLDERAAPVSVNPEGKSDQNIVMWLDHRAQNQTDRINATGHEALKYVGGRMSVEMQMPKLLWLKENLPDSWKRAAKFFDLPDYLTFRATGHETRSACSLVCKWTYLGHENGGRGKWPESLFRQIGLEELLENHATKIGADVKAVGECHGNLSELAAEQLGLVAGIPVGVSMIDAHAGGLGLLGARTTESTAALGSADLERRLALIGGTSSCHMAVSAEPRFVPGVWGPYYSAMLPDLWLTEGGQSATGALIDHVIFSHARAAELKAEAEKRSSTVYAELNARLERLFEQDRQRLGIMAALTAELHVLPDFHGNRSPRADASLRGMISGLKLSDSLDALALLYYATVQAVAHGTRHIIDTMNAHGYAIDTLIATGGDTKNPVFLQEHADATGCRVVLPKTTEAVLLGSAIVGAVAANVGAVAAKRGTTLLETMTNMSAADRLIEPSYGATAQYHEAKHRVFLRLHDDQMKYRALMQEGQPGN